MPSEHTQDANTLRFSDFCRVPAQKQGDIDNLNCTSGTQHYNIFDSKIGNYLIVFSRECARQALASVEQLLPRRLAAQWDKTAKRRRCPIIRGTLRRRLIPFAKTSS